MPVPVPVISRLPAHPIHKKAFSHSGAPLQSIHTLTQSLPLPPSGPPPSYGTREEWISSLPDWRRNKPRRIWEEDEVLAPMQGFLPGLTNAANASVIKGQRAQACIPPEISLIDFTHHQNKLNQQTPPLPAQVQDDAGSFGGDDDEMDSSFEYDVASQWSAQGSDENTMDVDDSNLARLAVAAYPTNAPRYDRGAFTPVFEATSPEHGDRPDLGSSPLGPVTPFGDFVDRAVAATVGYDRSSYPPVNFAGFPSFLPKADNTAVHAQPAIFEPHQEPVPAPAQAPEPASAPSTIAYKKVADPLADWMAMYVWKACTVGMSLPQKYQPRTGQHELRYSSLPPTYLATAIRSLFMSTLLQPSAILLAVWYIVRLPVCFGSMDKRADRIEETYFRTELLGMNEWHGVTEREAIEMDAAFRLVLLGCMLANKWLDDHTFSNKTWHTISGVPILSLNRLEVYALSIFNHDLSVPTPAWLQWLNHILTHQAASSPIGPPQPISRPSSDPRAIIRRTVDHILDVSTQLATPRPCDKPSCSLSHVEPAFLNQDERKMRVDQQSIELEIDLDEDGPLREEYMPKRRVSRTGVDRLAAHGDEWAAERALPPPAKWSPNGDEPLARGVNDRSRQYVAVQPPSMAPPPAPPLQSSGPYAPWNAVPIAAPQVPKVQLPPIYAPPPPLPTYPHARSASLANMPLGLHEQAPSSLAPCHGRSFSQSQYGYACSDMRMTAANPTYQEPYWPTGANMGPTADSYRGGYSYHPFDAMSFAPPASWIRV